MMMMTSLGDLIIDIDLNICPTDLFWRTGNDRQIYTEGHRHFNMHLKHDTPLGRPTYLPQM